MGVDALAILRKAVLDQRYVLTEHAYDEMDDDNLDVLDIESAILTGALAQVLTDDPRGTRFVVHGKACDQSTSVAVVARCVEDGKVLVVTVYELE
ncbi:MAG TPA: DUF4258 domain-containing protein [Planctomycetota bacterium]|jgi:hypothetical protein